LEALAPVLAVLMQAPLFIGPHLARGVAAKS